MPSEVLYTGGVPLLNEPPHCRIPASPQDQHWTPEDRSFFLTFNWLCLRSFCPGGKKSGPPPPTFTVLAPGSSTVSKSIHLPLYGDVQLWIWL